MQHDRILVRTDNMAMERRERTPRECIEAGADLLKAGVRVDEAAAHACGLARDEDRAEVHVGVEARALELARAAA